VGLAIHSSSKAKTAFLASRHGVYLLHRQFIATQSEIGKISAYYTFVCIAVITWISFQHRVHRTGVRIQLLKLMLSQIFNLGPAVDGNLTFTGRQRTNNDFYQSGFS